MGARHASAYHARDWLREWAVHGSSIDQTWSQLQSTFSRRTAFWAALQPHARGSRAYVNLLGEVGEDVVLATYGAATHDQLARIKAIYDPDNIFHVNLNMKPARAT